MYRNPLNNGDISDYNLLKKQRDYKPMIDKYKKKLPTEPTELQKYYQYMTYQQPILDEANYVAERMRTEDINKQKDDFNFIEDLKIKREEEMKKKSQLEKDMNNDIRTDLFDYASTVKYDDLTPTINTDIEMTNDLFDDNLSMADTILMIEDKKPEKKAKKIPMIEDKKPEKKPELFELNKKITRKQMINDLYSTGQFKNKSQLNLTKDELLKLYKKNFS